MYDGNKYPKAWTTMINKPASPKPAHKPTLAAKRIGATKRQGRRADQAHPTPRAKLVNPTGSLNKKSYSRRSNCMRVALSRQVTMKTAPRYNEPTVVTSE